MIKSLFFSLFMGVTLTLGMFAAIAQDIHYNPLNTSPLSLNPAFAGMFDGQIRAGVIYRNQWSDASVPYITYGCSVDFPVYTFKNGSFFAGGVHLLKDEAGDGNLTNFTGALTVAYHKTFSAFSKDKKKNSDLAIGFQGAYSQKSIDLSKIYFGDEFSHGYFIPGIGPYPLGFGNHISYYFINAGISFDYSVTSRFNYTIGFSGYNLNQPNDAIEKKQNNQMGLNAQWTGVLIANWNVAKKITIQPALIYQNTSDASYAILGSDFRINTSGKTIVSSAFIGGWYRTGDMFTLTGGIQLQAFHIGFSYDYAIATVNSSANGTGGFEVHVKCIVPKSKHLAHKKHTSVNK